MQLFSRYTRKLAKPNQSCSDLLWLKQTSLNVMLDTILPLSGESLNYRWL